MEKFLQGEYYRLQYYIYHPDRKKALIFFHGFDQDHTAVEPLIPYLQETRIVSLNLFGHQLSNIKIDLKENHLKEIFNDLFEKEQLHDATLMAFSLGGKYALKLIEVGFPVKSALLMAPDGLIKNPWYNFATKYNLTRRLFKKFVENPEFLKPYVHWLNKMGLLNPKLKRIYETYAADRTLREKVFHVWMIHRFLKPSILSVANRIKEKKIRTHLLFGQKDVVIPPDTGKKLLKHAAPYATAEVLPCGHQIIREENLSLIADYIRSLG